jgi:hypothetical protein
VIPAFLAALLVGRANLNWCIPHQNDRRRRIVTQGRATHLEMPGTVASTDPAAAAQYCFPKSALREASFSQLFAGAHPTLRSITITGAASADASPMHASFVPLDLRNTDTLTSLLTFTAAVPGCPLRIGAHALANLPVLSSVDLSGCTVATIIGDDFCARSPRLEAIKLPPNVTSLGSSFLLDSFALKSLDLGPLTKLAAIGQNFCSGCRSLRDVAWPAVAGASLQPAHGTATDDAAKEVPRPKPPPPVPVGAAMLLGVRLTAEWAPLAPHVVASPRDAGVTCPIAALRMNAIPKSFAQSCPGLVRCDLLGATWVTSVGDEAFSRCADLRHIIFPPSVVTIGRYVCTVCRELESVDLSASTELEDFETTADCFAVSCPALQRLALPAHLRGFPSYMARFCDALVAVAMGTADGEVDGMAAMVRASHGAFEGTPFRAQLLFSKPNTDDH